MSVDITALADPQVITVHTAGPQGIAGPTAVSADVGQQASLGSDGLILVTGLVPDDDARLSDARTPVAHTHTQGDVTGLTDALASKAASVHAHAPSDVTGLTDALAGKVGTGDARLSDARTPLAHSHAESDVTGLTDALSSKVGTSDARLTDARTPLAHAASHAAAGADPITPLAIGARAENRVTFSNTDAICASGTRYLGQIGTMSAPRTVTLPAASAVPAGAEIVIADDSGTVTSTNSITVQRAGSDTINGAASVTIGGAYGWRRLMSDGVSAWHLDGGVLRASSNLADVGAPATALANLGGLDTFAAAPACTAASAQSYIGQPALSAATTAMYEAGRLYAWPFPLPAGTFDRCYAELTAGAAGSTCKLGLYAVGSGGRPGALLADLGTIDGNTTGIQSVTISLTVTGGWYWLGVLPVAGNPTWRSVVPALPIVAISPTTTGVANYQLMYGNGGLAALPNPAAAANRDSARTSVPRIQFRRSA